MVGKHLAHGVLFDEIVLAARNGNQFAPRAPQNGQQIPADKAVNAGYENTAAVQWGGGLSIGHYEALRPKVHSGKGA
jgi:hypothetical protein